MQQIPYDRIPGQPSIFVDAVMSFDRVSRFFNGDFRDAESFRKVWRDVQSLQFQRREVSDILVEEQEQFGNSQAALENAKLIARPECAAVLTGQQIGVLGGPLYTVIKAVAAVQWAKHLADVLDTPVVPIFWMEGEDHDFEEVRPAHLLDQDGKLVSVALEDTRPDSHYVVGWHRPGREMNGFLKQLDEVLPLGLHHDDVMKKVRACYSSDVSLSEAFGRWISGWLGGRGLVVTESLNPEMKRAAASCFKRAVNRSDILAGLFRERMQVLEDSALPCTLTPSLDFHFFYILDRGVRIPVPRLGSANGMTPEVLSTLAVEHPEFFSPKAVLRPIVQDTLFPTVAIVAGPGEMSYFPQVQPFYEDFDRPMPVIVPRPGITLLEKTWSKNLHRLSLEPEDLFLPWESLNKKLLTQDDAEVISGLESRVSHVKEALGDLTIQASKVGGRLEQGAEKFQQDIDSRMQKFVSKAQDILASRNRDTEEMVQRLRTAIFPGGVLQERGLNPLTFLVRHGFDWVANRLASVPIDEYEHFVIPLEE
jgi:bacillithiol biosynthesis cysteine-adding enzyme BshC